MRECHVKQCPPLAFTRGAVLGGRVWWEYSGARRSGYIEHSEFPIFFFQDDARQISQYSCLTPIHDPGAI